MRNTGEVPRGRLVQGDRGEMAQGDNLVNGVVPEHDSVAMRSMGCVDPNTSPSLAKLGLDAAAIFAEADSKLDNTQPLEE